MRKIVFYFFHRTAPFEDLETSGKINIKLSLFNFRKPQKKWFSSTNAFKKFRVKFPGYGRIQNSSVRGFWARGGIMIGTLTQAASFHQQLNMLQPTGWREWNESEWGTMKQSRVQRQSVMGWRPVISYPKLFMFILIVYELFGFPKPFVCLTIVNIHLAFILIERAL